MSIVPMPPVYNNIQGSHIPRVPTKHRSHLIDDPEQYKALAVDAFLRENEFVHRLASSRFGLLISEGSKIAHHKDGKICVNYANKPTLLTLDLLNRIPGVAVVRRDSGALFLNGRRWNGKCATVNTVTFEWSQ